MLNGLCQSVVTLTAPGIPDIYPRGELCDLRLIDPDNRRPVEFEQRRRALTEIRPMLQWPAAERSAALRDLLEGWKDGRIKLAAIAALLDCRQRESALFARGGYQPLEFDGPQANHLLGYGRHCHGRSCFVIVGRLFASLIGDQQDVYPGASLWSDTALVPPDDRPRLLKNALTGATLSAQNNRLRLSEILCDLPAAVLLDSPRD